LRIGKETRSMPGSQRSTSSFHLEHIVIPSLDPDEICRFAAKHKDKIDFAIVGPEKPIIAGLRDLVEKETSIPVICPTEKYAIEKSKVTQRTLFQEVVPEVNPRFKVFYPKDYKSPEDVKKCLFKWLDELDNKVAVKPDAPAAGKGVGVWGDHFNTRQELYEHFMANFKEGPVIVEEKIEGEESSFQAFCDGKHLLPFMDKADWEKEKAIVEKIFSKLRGDGSNPELRGVPFYVAFIHTARGPMILENNSRPGDPEIMNILPILKDDFVDVCFRMIEGSLTRVEVEEKATVVTYKVPPSYGEYEKFFPEKVKRNEIGTPVILEKAERLTSKYGDRIRIYPGSMELREDGKAYALRSRTVCTVGIGDDIQSAREISLDGLEAIEGGALWYRTDIASEEHISRSIRHMEQLRKNR